MESVRGSDIEEGYHERTNHKEIQSRANALRNTVGVAHQSHRSTLNNAADLHYSVRYHCFAPIFSFEERESSFCETVTEVSRYIAGLHSIA